MALLPLLSLQPVFDLSGIRVLDARLSVFVPGTTTPARTYVDSGLSNRHPHPIPARGDGLLPLVYVAPGTFRLRVTDKDGVQLLQIDDVPVVDPITAGGGGGSIDDKRLAQTGDVKDRYGVGTHPGWVRMNGRTIGSKDSSASERQNDDCHDLYVFLWNADPNLAVSGGRSSNAESDWLAAKTIALPDQRGRARIALDDLGSTAAGRLVGGLFGFGSGTVLGSYGGEASHVQTLAEMASHSHTITASMDNQGSHAHTGSTAGAGAHAHDGGTSAVGDHAHGGSTDTFGGGQLGIPYSVIYPGYGSGTAIGTVTAVGQGGANTLGYTASGFSHAHNFTTAGAGGHAHSFTTNGVGDHAHNFSTAAAGLHAHNITAAATTTGSSAAMSWLPPFVLVTSYIKL